MPSWPDSVYTDTTVHAHAVSPTDVPTVADLVTVAAASASADTAVIGISHPKVTAAAVPDAAEATSPIAAFSANTTSTRTSSTIR